MLQKEKDMQKSIMVRYDSQFDRLSKFNHLNGKTQNLFFSIMTEISRQRRNGNLQGKYLLKFLDVRRLAGLTTARGSASQEVLNQMLNDINIKLCEFIHITQIRRRKIYLNYQKINLPLPANFVWVQDDAVNNFKEVYLDITITPKAETLFFTLDESRSMTQFPLNHYVSISKKFAKAIYRQLLDPAHADVGEYRTTVENFMTDIGTNNIGYVKKILPEILRQLRKTGDFASIYCHSYFDEIQNSDIIRFRYNLAKARACSISIEESPSGTIPTLAEVALYFDAFKKKMNIHNDVSAEDFFDTYESVGWKLYHTRIQDWKALARVWIRANSPVITDLN